MQARTIRPRNWRTFQHYKQRRPPWIRLHRALLDDFDFASLPIASRALAPLLWLLASEAEDGTIQADTDHLAFRLRWKPKEIDDALNPLIEKGFFSCVQRASEPLADGKQNETTETEAETEAEAEAETETDITPASPAGSSKFRMHFIREVFEYWQAVHSKPRAKLDAKRTKLVRAALDLGYTVDDLRAAIDGCKASPFHQGDNDRHAVYDDLGLIFRDASRIDQFIGFTTHKPSRLGRAAAKTAAAARDWIEEGSK